MTGIPGVGTTVETHEANIFWGGDASRIQILRKDIKIKSTAVDAGNTARTTVLRPGLILGKVTADGECKEYDNAASDGSEVAYGVLEKEVDLLDENGAARDAFVSVVVSAPVRVESLLIEGAAFLGDAAEAATRADLNAKRFYLSDEY